MTGRPSDYSDDLADLICAELADGRSLRSVCKDEGMPDRSTVFRWLRTNEAFRGQYARAKAEGADALVDEIVDIADDSVNDYVLGKEGLVFDSEHVQRAKLRIDSRKWIASKLKPKVYGDRLELDGKQDLNVNVAVRRFAPETEPAE